LQAIQQDDYIYGSNDIHHILYMIYFVFNPKK